MQMQAPVRWLAVEKGLVGSPLPKGTQDAQDALCPQFGASAVTAANETFFFFFRNYTLKVLTKNLSHT